MGDQRLVVGLLSPGSPASARATIKAAFSASTSSGRASTPAFMKLWNHKISDLRRPFSTASELFKPSPRSAAARCVADFSSRSLPTDNSSVPRSAPPHHPPSPARQTVHGPAACTSIENANSSSLSLQFVRVTHPFHPLFERRLPCVGKATIGTASASCCKVTTAPYGRFPHNGPIFRAWIPRLSWVMGGRFYAPSI